MLHVQKYLARKVRFFKLYNCNNYLFLDILYEFERNFKKILFVSVSSYFLLAKLHLAYLNNFLFCSRYLNIISMFKLSNFSK